MSDDPYGVPSGYVPTGPYAGNRPATREEKISNPGVYEVPANSRQISGTHYSKHKIQPWDYVAANNLGYFEGSVVKYVTRWRDKGGLEDLKKARHFLDKLIEVSS